MYLELGSLFLFSKTLNFGAGAAAIPGELNK